MAEHLRWGLECGHDKSRKLDRWTGAQRVERRFASLLSGFAEQLLAEGIPVVRAYLALPTVNPTITTRPNL